MILLRRPFRRGDQIKVGDIEGTVQAVETRATLVKTYAGRVVIVPNSEIYTRAGVMFALKQATENAGISLPADTKISFAQTPLIVSRTPRPRRETRSAEVSCANVEREAAPSADTASNPETETPLPGELSEGAELVPR